MLPLYFYGTFFFAVLRISVLVQGNNDVIVRVKDNRNNYINVSFPRDTDHSFEAFYQCVCEYYKMCKGDFSETNIISSLQKDNNNGRSRLFYDCYRVNNAIQCDRKNRQPNGQVNQILKCASEDVTLVWNNINEGLVFNTRSLCDKYCVSGCYCPATSRTTTKTTPTAPKTKTTIATTTSTDTTTSPSPPTNTLAPTTSSLSFIDFSSTSLSTAANSFKNDSYSSSVGLIIGVVIAVIVIAVIIVIIGLFIWRRKLKQNASKQQKGTNRSTGTDLRSLPPDIFLDFNSNSSHSILSASSNYSHTEGSSAMHEYSKILDENSVNEGKSKQDKVMSLETDTKIQSRTLASGYELAQVVDQNDGDLETFNGGDGDDYGYSAISDTINTELAKNEEGNECAASQKGEYGYSTVQDQDSKVGGNQTVSMSQYELAATIETTSKDTGYQYAGPENSYDTPTNNRAAHLNNHSPNETVPNINGTYSLAGNTNETSTETMSDKSKSIYSKLHEDKRQIQNPYNTLSQPTDEATTPAPLAGFSHHSSQTANQSSGYSFAQPITNGMTNQNTDDNTRDNNKSTTSQSHTYHVLEPSTEEGPQEGKENGDNLLKKRNNYFELEKQENVSDFEI